MWLMMQMNLEIELSVHCLRLSAHPSCVWCTPVILLRGRIQGQDSQWGAAVLFARITVVASVLCCLFTILSPACVALHEVTDS